MITWAPLYVSWLGRVNIQKNDKGAKGGSPPSAGEDVGASDQATYKTRKGPLSSWHLIIYHSQCPVLHHGQATRHNT
jgi:hypothetical protein